MAGEVRALTLRFGEDEAAQLDAIAQAEGRSVSSLLREAVAALVAQRRGDPTFQQRLAASAHRHRKVIERLSES